MKTKNYLELLYIKIEKAYTSIQYGPYDVDKQKDPFYKELIDFCNENNHLDLKELNILIEEKYGDYLKIYDQKKKEKQLSTITTILVVFLIITIVSIILGIVFATSFTSSIHSLQSTIRYSF